MNRFFVAASAAISGLRPPARFADFQFGAEELEDTVAAIIASAEFDLPGEWGQPDFEDDNEAEADEDDETGPRSWEHHRPR